MYFVRIGIALSVLLNVLLGGKSNQTFSARNWALKREGKPNLVRVIDIFFMGLQHIGNFVLKHVFKSNCRIDNTYHCMVSWSYWNARQRLPTKRDILETVNYEGL